MEIVDFTKALLWPAVAVFVVGVLHKPLADFLGNVGKVTWKSGDNQVILERLERKKKTVTALVTAATAAAPPSMRDPRFEDGHSDIVPNTLSASEVVHLASDVGQTITARSVRHFEKGRILWVDDQPLKNKYLIEAFRELGIRVDLAESTEGALAYFDRNHRYAALITDMGRPGDSTAGYTLLEALRKRGNRVPLIIYVGSDSEEERRKAEASESTSRPHVESTDRPERLFNFVTEILRDAKV